VDDWREINAEWLQDTAFVASNAAGGCVQMGSMDGQPALSPMELLLASLAGCTGSDVASILQKARQPLQAFQVRVRGKRRQEHPRIYTQIEVEYLLWGSGLDLQTVERAIQLSREKYCSVSAMLEPATNIEFTYRVLPPEAAG